MEETLAPSDQAQLCQIIQDDYTFSPTCKDEMAAWSGDFFSLGFDYNIVSILGPQSGGKSTLLNMLFHTRFVIMDESRRQQTTKGLWLAHDKTKHALIMDVEGTDSKERGEKHINFERKSALFSLALSEVLIINMWANDVGRYSAANYDTLRTVFEINLKLFHSADSPKTLLLFILRDHQTTPLENLAGTLLSDMENIWSEISKPAEFEHSEISQFFDFEFTSLPNFVYERQRFEEGVQELAGRFEDRKRSDAFFKAAYSKRIPADGFPEFAARIWEKIMANKDLDLPSVKEMLATVRCEEIALAAVKEIKALFKDDRARLEQGHVVSGLGERIQREHKHAMEMYDKQGSLYHEPIYRGRREALEEQLQELYDGMRKNQLVNLMKLESQRLQQALTAELPDILLTSKADTWAKVGRLFNDTLEKAEGSLKPQVIALGYDESAWQVYQSQLYEKAVALTRRKSEEIIANARPTMLKRFESHFKFDENRIPREWDKDTDIPAIYLEARQHALSMLGALTVMTLPGFNGGEEVQVELLNDIQVTKLQDGLEQDIKPLYDEALQRQRRSMAGQAPPVWAILLVMILGFNEFMSLLSFLTNPANLLMVIMGAVLVGAVVVLHQLNLLGPVEAVMKAVLSELMYQAQNGLQLLTERMHEGANRMLEEGQRPSAKKDE